MEAKHKDLTEKIIGAFFTVYNTLGYGFLEKVYENAMAVELSKSGLQARRQAPINVYYDGHVVGEYFADIQFENSVILELKATRELVQDFEAQLLNYLKATPYEVGLRLNFGPRPRIVRKTFDNERKGTLSWIAK